LEGLIEGRIVHYVAYNNRHLAAIVIGVGFADDIDMPGTWHWIERA
jgi:hypothetical protein